MQTTGIIKAFVIISLAASLQASAQWSGSVELGTGYDDNAFGNSTVTPSSYGTAGLSLGFFPEDSRFGISYSGLFATYGAFPDRRYGLHGLLASYSLPYGGEDRNALTMAGSLNLRSDADAYNYYDYNQGMGYLGVRHYLTQTLSGNGGYSIKYRNYPNFSNMSYAEHVGWLGGNTSFESRTSITLRAEIGLKNYAPVTDFAADPGTSVTSGVTGAGPGIEGGGPGGSGTGGSGGHGGGMGGGMGERMGNGGMMNQIGQNFSGMSENAQIITYDDELTSQFRTSLTVGQGISESTGLSATYVKRINLTDRSRAVVGGTVDFIGEDDLFDDPYSYESDETSLRVTQILPAAMKLRIGGFMRWKDYGYVSNIDDPDSPLRSDRRYGGFLTLTKTISGGWMMFSGLELSVGYTYARNESNTLWYDYSSNGATFGIGTEF